MKLRDLTEQIRVYEREMAPGSETGLWGTFWGEYREKIEDDEDLDTTDIVIPDEDGEIWLMAYQKLAEFEEAGENYSIEDLF